MKSTLMIWQFIMVVLCLNCQAGGTENKTSYGFDSLYHFTASVPLEVGNNTITIEATDFDDNIAQKQYSLDITGGTPPTLSFDDNGNTLSDGTRTYTRDAENRLKTITVGGDVYSFDYDYLNRRVKESLNGTLIKQFVWCGSGICEVRNGSNAVQSRYYANGEERNGTAYYTFKDHLGSLRELTDGSGNIVAQYEYTPYGERTKLQGSLDTNIGFTGHYTHETGLVLTHFRAYDPALGRWLSSDPLGEMGPDGANTYAYVNNNPINYFDPDGRAVVVAAALAVIEVGGNVADVYTGIRMLQNPHTSRDEVAAFGVGVVVGVFTPGSWGWAAKKLGKAKSGVQRFISKCRSSPNRTIKNGDILLREFDTPKGVVEIAAEARVKGDVLKLKDIAVYPKGAENLNVGAREVLKVRNGLADEAASQGFRRLRITGERVSGANPGKKINVKVDLDGR